MGNVRVCWNLEYLKQKKSYIGILKVRVCGFVWKMLITAVRERLETFLGLKKFEIQLIRNPTPIQFCNINGNTKISGRE